MSRTAAWKSAGLLILLALGAAAALWRIDPPPPPVKPPAELGADGWSIVGRAGLDLGGFFQPRGIVGLPDGGFIVVDRKARVQHFDARGQALELWTMKEHALGNPKDIGLLPNGNLLVVDTHYGRVREMTIHGGMVKSWGEPGLEPGQFTHPIAIAIDEKRGWAYVAEYGAYNDRIQKFTLDGTLVKFWGSFGEEPGQLRRASGLALDPDGNLWVADAVNHRLQRFDPEGKLLGVFGALGSEPGQLRFPYDIDADARGNLYVAEFGNHRVSVFHPDGSFSHLLGGPGHTPGLFHCPWSLAVDRQGKLLVSDTANHRVQILSLGGAAETRVAHGAPDGGGAHAR